MSRYTTQLYDCLGCLRPSLLRISSAHAIHDTARATSCISSARDESNSTKCRGDDVCINLVYEFSQDSLQVYMTDFFLFARLNLPNVLISVAKNFSIAIFLPRVLMCQKHQISLPVGYKTATPKTGDWKRL